MCVIRRTRLIHIQIHYSQYYHIQKFMFLISILIWKNITNTVSFTFSWRKNTWIPLASITASGNNFSFVVDRPQISFVFSLDQIPLSNTFSIQLKLCMIEFVYTVFQFEFVFFIIYCFLFHLFVDSSGDKSGELIRTISRSCAVLLFASRLMFNSVCVRLFFLLCFCLRQNNTSKEFPSFSLSSARLGARHMVFY